ncbi:fucolectin-1-like isoform X2 [Anneissia japonica]|uniref:fucolectin-1-like isoform X2 n=1 Tax=Anneissia japonica TaxID=1529436 RepID=UPI001425843E|nr:fucolectin-1-like isoform X2 [Anneissia japonica]
MNGPTSATMDKYTSQSLHGDRIFNVAFETNESSTRSGYPPAFPAFDDDIGPDPHDSNGTAVCSHTEKEKEPWWYVDIQDLHTIKHVVLYNRQDLPGRLEGAQVRVGKSKNNLKLNTACGPPVSEDEADVPAGKITLRCEPGTIGNIVSVQLENRTQYLVLCEVKLYGTIYTDTCVAEDVIKNNIVYSFLDTQLGIKAVSVQTCPSPSNKG